MSTRQNMPQRKHRNGEEKSVVVDEVIRSVQQLPLAEPTLAALKKLLEDYVESESGCFQGTLEAPEIQRRIDYFLPTRRILRPFVKIPRLDESR